MNCVVTTHGLRATMVTMLIDAGYSDSTIALRTGHRDLRSLASCQNLTGKIGVEQVGRMYGETASEEKLVKETQHFLQEP